MESKLNKAKKEREQQTKTRSEKPRTERATDE
ncbi:hypothetical protein CCACVL1_19616 [Corchorus capsularis]|uniref:Uncharacterized protein n=1 Tax=Corchorus capsularis TaxID=210143 RepID=A0A1R3HFV1_COCAP|nr:hypothetical protein CCACVL1_19616 [Corchorus capsularis]